MSPEALNDLEKIELSELIKKKRMRGFLWGVGATILVGCGIWALHSVDSYPRGPQIASIRLDGEIFDDQYRDEMLQELDQNEDVKALIVKVDSGGGAVYPSEKLYRQFRKIAEDVPVIAVMEGAAASGALIASLGADYIIAGETTVTASIGVITEIPDVTEALARLGVKNTLVRSSNAKGGISPTHTPTAEELADAQSLIDELYGWFRDLVKERRSLTDNALNSIADGSVITGREAVKIGLVDAIGDEQSAIDYIDTQNPELAELPVLAWEPEYPIEDGGLITTLTRNLVRAFLTEAHSLSEPSARLAS